MNAELLRMVRQPDELAIENAFYDGDFPHFFAVDWRASDDEIVTDCAACLGLTGLRAQWRDEALAIVRDRQESVVPLTGTEADRHLTLVALNRLLLPEYEIRFLVCSHGCDTVGFAALTAEDWRTLERECPQSLGENFLPLNGLPNIFTELTESHLPVPARARFRRMMNRNR